ncbi:MAG: DUF2812 domain-containing protein [Lachnospiraceae bacterium]|nr:DUF2812 domain-containing protein [Lachnospiraceae bacterium]
MIKFRFYLDKDAETEWLNQMSADGWAMKSFFAGFFRFEKCERGEYVYQVDFGDRLFSVSSDYRELMQDAGIEIVQTWTYWVILRKKASEGKFELYTDVASAIEHYKKIRRMFKVATIIEMLCIFIELYCGAAEGILLGYAFALFLGAFLVGLLNVLIRLNNTIAELNASLTGIERSGRHRNISALMAVGLLMNSCAIMLTDVISHGLRHAIQILAVVLMFCSLLHMFRRK